MARKNSPQPAEATRDVPRLGFSCGSYADGHNVHYAPATKVAPTLVPVPARLVTDGDGLFLVQGEARVPVYHHNPAGVVLLLEELGSSCDWFATLHLVRWAREDAHHWVSLATEPVGPCASREESVLAERAFWS